MLGFCSKKHNIPKTLSRIPIFLLTVCFWNMACSSCGATQEPLTEPRAAAHDHLAWLNKAFQQLLWLKCQNYGSIQVPLLLKDFSVLRGQLARTEQRAGTLGKQHLVQLYSKLLKQRLRHKSFMYILYSWWYWGNISCWSQKTNHFWSGLHMFFHSVFCSFCGQN